jgi:hypothetical protein
MKQCFTLHWTAEGTAPRKLGWTGSLVTYGASSSPTAALTSGAHNCMCMKLWILHEQYQQQCGQGGSASLAFSAVKGRYIFYRLNLKTCNLHQES